MMRHSSITLTLDTYGHLFPGQEADAVARLGDLMAGRSLDAPEALRATGTEGSAHNQEHNGEHKMDGGTRPDPARRDPARIGRGA